MLNNQNRLEHLRVKLLEANHVTTNQNELMDILPRLCKTNFPYLFGVNK